MLQRIQSHLSFWKLWGGSNISRARTVYLPDLYILPISNGEKILSKVNVVVWGQVKSENSSLSFAVLTSKTRVLKFPNRSQKVSKCGKNVSETLGYRLQWHFFCSYHILTPSVIYYWTDAPQHGIYLLNRNKILKQPARILLGLFLLVYIVVTNKSNVVQPCLCSYRQPYASLQWSHIFNAVITCTRCR